MTGLSVMLKVRRHRAIASQCRYTAGFRLMQARVIDERMSNPESYC